MPGRFRYPRPVTDDVGREGTYRFATKERRGTTPESRESGVNAVDLTFRVPVMDRDRHGVLTSRWENSIILALVVYSE